MPRGNVGLLPKHATVSNADLALVGTGALLVSMISNKLSGLSPKPSQKMADNGSKMDLTNTTLLQSRAWMHVSALKLPQVSM